MKKVEVKLTGNPYQVIIGSGIINSVPKEIKKRKLNRNILVVIDGNVERTSGSTIKSALSGHEGMVKYFTLKPGENSKSPEMLNRIYSFLLKNNYGRDSVIVAAGGGVTGDISGFAAATYMRGIQYVQIPTTLLAAVDSSVGGKTGINFYKTKNMIGAFYQPEFVIAELDFFQTLPDEEITCGLGEIIKYAFLADQKFYEYIDKNLDKIIIKDTSVLEKVVSECVKIKAAVVAQDEREGGIRKILNLGHTFAHAYETVLNYKIKHGEAVIAGLACALNLSLIMNIIDQNRFDSLSHLVKRVKPRIKFDRLDKSALYKVMLKDKKNRNGRIRFVLPSEPGVILLDVEADKKDVFRALDHTGIFFQ